jgi:serine/threonine-protein kinase RsbW
MFDNNPTLTASTSVRAGADAIPASLEFVRAFIISANCGADAEARLAIIVEELVANIIEHGNPAPDSDITLELAAIGADIGLTLTDSGITFDPRDAEISDMIPERGGGAGLALVRTWAHIIDYERAEGRNVLRLVIPEHV